ncbi:VOC family protein [Rhizobacter sp. AJA081-3]|uniref:VOC family protein n=1 Tax=Rhizobacter sp. AJA081-3 TaxID=2753607 RepID=UPI001ADF7AB1|nr:VOC family protein [Rhizobacter sp. AJA081-3]QTN23478.1 VOC family protein [Rhizobacter sp. AJA081-3]
MSWSIDHLVIGAATLEQGAAWCAATLGVLPGPGGKHPLMGTHNLLLAIGSPAFPRAYLEIIAIDAQASAPGRRRWYDLDDPALRAALAAGPRLIHWVAGCDDAAAECATLADAGIDRGEVLQAERDTPRGLLRWRISVRSDGQRLAGGALPTLIEWGDTHPAASLAASPVRLAALAVGKLPVAVARQLPAGVSTEEAFSATLDTPLGPVRLEGLA